MLFYIVTLALAIQDALAVLAAHADLDNSAVSLALAIQDALAVLAAHADLDNSAVSLDNPPRRGTTQI